MPSRITLKMIAARAGMHITTVSMALRDHPALAEATRNRIKAVANEMGYTRDPLLSALVAYRTNNRPAIEHGVIAWVDIWPTPNGARDEFPELWQGAFENARKLGWKLEEFRPLHEGLSLPQFSRILRSRGIDGLIIAPMPDGVTEIELEWPWFSAVTPSHSLMSPRLHSIVTNQGRNMRTICEKLHSTGYRKPGLVLDCRDHPTISRNWFRNFIGLQYCLSNPADIIPPLEQSQFDAVDFIAWFNRHRPDALILLNSDLYIGALKDANINIPEDVVIGVPRPPAGSCRIVSKNTEAVSWSINENWPEIGRHAVDILIGMLHRGEKGLPKAPMTISVDGVLLESSALVRTPVSG